MVIEMSLELGDDAEFRFLTKYLYVLSQLRDRESIVGSENIEKICALYKSKLQSNYIEDELINYVNEEHLVKILLAFNQHLPKFAELMVDQWIERSKGFVDIKHISYLKPIS